MAKELPEDVKRKMAISNRNIDRIYDTVSGPNPNMSRAEFRKEFKALADPRLIRNDMETIALQKKVQEAGMLN